MKFIEGYEELYSVDEMGRVYSHKSKKFLKARNGPHGYKTVALYLNGKAKHKYVHRLVMETFGGSVEGKPEVNHRKGDKGDNQLSSLEWSTHRDNVKHAYATGLKKVPRGDLNSRTKHSEATIKKVHELRASGLKHREIAAIFGMSKKYVGDVLSQRIRKLK